MNFLLALFVSVAGAQQQAIIPTAKIDAKGSLQAIQQSLDAKFSIYGGTATGNYFIKSSSWSCINQPDICVNGTSRNLVIGASAGLTFTSGSGITYGDGTTQTTAPAATPGVASTSTLCDGGGLLISSGSINNTPRITINFLGSLVSSRTFHLDIVVLSSDAINGPSVQFNNDVNSLYSLNGMFAGTAINENRDTMFCLPLVYDGSGGADTRRTTAGTPISSRLTFMTVSSTTAMGFITAQSMNAVQTNPVYYQASGWYDGSAPITRMDIIANKNASCTTAPTATAMFSTGHYSLCAQGWQDSQ